MPFFGRIRNQSKYGNPTSPPSSSSPLDKNRKRDRTLG
eukprot:CAMPEP_0184425894 /NCGR_PEP_ID=MMETSP0738-20130409/142017_1 /TAXON_ID=385413 /ORGANISM="Thalassiosira miniscula, Strain CCMP1093" /LENGTH=37 /DNA_ID= /DNA_START= /DNA_END= /DNA_ORIENTATION=